MSTRRVVLASSNAGKLREFSDLLGSSGFEFSRQSDFQIAPPPETGKTFLENALIKARNAARIARLPAIADDSGIEVDALDGAPGVHSARFAGEDASDEQNLDKLLRALDGLPAERRTALACVGRRARYSRETAGVSGATGLRRKNGAIARVVLLTRRRPHEHEQGGTRDGRARR